MNWRIGFEQFMGVNADTEVEVVNEKAKIIINIWGNTTAKNSVKILDLNDKEDFKTLIDVVGVVASIEYWNCRAEIRFVPINKENNVEPTMFGMTPFEIMQVCWDNISRAIEVRKDLFENVFDCYGYFDWIEDIVDDEDEDTPAINRAERVYFIVDRENSVTRTCRYAIVALNGFLLDKPYKRASFMYNRHKSLWKSVNDLSVNEILINDDGTRTIQRLK